jgi:hypothetical protein
MAKYSAPVLPLDAAEKKLIAHFNTDPKYTPEGLLATLKSALQVAVEVELATIPIYLYSYYSINRTAGDERGEATPLQHYANHAGAALMSVATEEMLHLSLSANILYALGGSPQIYLKTPSAYPSNLPGHGAAGPDGLPMAIPLAPFSYAQLWKFLEIEYPKPFHDPVPEMTNWQTIGQLYSYVRCLILCDKITDEHFLHNDKKRQIQPDYYSPNNIDTIYPKGNFNPNQPPSGHDSAARHARYTDSPDSHAGKAELITISGKQQAVEAICTICYQGEGLDDRRFDDDSHQEKSHYFKFVKLQSELCGYPEADKLPKHPASPPPAATQFGDLSPVVFNFPTNPLTANYPAEYQDLSNLCNGVFQYMMILTETIFKVEGMEQKLFFNQAMHMSMIWILDKLLRGMRGFTLPDGSALAPTFENYSLGKRCDAYANLIALADKITAASHPQQYAAIGDLLPRIKGLPDVSELWLAERLYKNEVPAFPAHPAGFGAPHACMGLNACRGQDRFGQKGHPDPHNPARFVVNECAGQGYCSTATDHTCHVRNDCRSQGGCGLYGTAEEQNHPGANACRSLGSCATPINAERFSTDGENQGKSVWQRARKVFHEKEWPKLRAANPALPEQLPDVPGGPDNLFADGPTFAWMQASSCMTACGSSGMSGAGSCG